MAVLLSAFALMSSFLPTTAAQAQMTPEPTASVSVDPASTVPTFVDATSTFVIPDVAGIEFARDGQVLTAGEYSVAPVAAGGLSVTITATATDGGPAPVPASWTHLFPQLVEPYAPVFDDANFQLKIQTKPGNVAYIEGWTGGLNGTDRIPTWGWQDMSAYAGKTVKVFVKSNTSKILLTGVTEWTHTFPPKGSAPSWDDLTSTVTIPSVDGVEYLRDGQVLPAGSLSVAPIPQGGLDVTITARATNGGAEPVPASWTHSFPQVVTPFAPTFDTANGQLKIQTAWGTSAHIKGWTGGLNGTDQIPNWGWVDVTSFGDQPVTVYVRSNTTKVLLTGTTEWTSTFQVRPVYTIQSGDEFGDAGLAKAWNVRTGTARGKNQFRPENITVHDGVLDIRTSRHCLSSPDEITSDANKNEGVCPPGTTTVYSSGQMVSGGIYDTPSVMEVKAKLGDIRGLTASAWIHTDKKFCSPTIPSSDIAEMDTMEVWAQDYSTASTHMTCENSVYHSDKVRLDKQLNDGQFHTWRMEYDGYAIRYYVDGQILKAPDGHSAVTAATLGLTQEKFAEIVNAQKWNLSVGVTTPYDGGWAPWVDDSQPFPDQHTLYEYIRFETYSGVPTTCAPYGAIGGLYAQHPELGTPMGCETDAATAGARVQRFTEGLIYWTPSLGAVIVPNAIATEYVALGGEAAYGLPTGPAREADGGLIQSFGRGSVYASTATGAHMVLGAIGQRYESVGAQAGKLGFPTTDEQCFSDGACRQDFQGGSIYWTPSTGAHVTLGAIGWKYGLVGAQQSFLGYPVGDEVCETAGCYQIYQGGTLYWSPRTGAYPVHGGIFAKYGAENYERGFLGFPASDEICTADGCLQRFEGGTIFWSPNYGTHWVRGAIANTYAGLSEAAGALGYPTTDELCGIRDGGCYQQFSGKNGHIYWSPATGAYAIYGGIFDYYAANRWEQGRFGYPTSNEQCRTDGDATVCEQDFQTGTITWNSLRGLEG